MRSISTIVLLSMPIWLVAQQGTAQAPVLNHKSPAPIAGDRQPDRTGDRSDALTLMTENFENGLNGWTVETPTGNVPWELTSTGNDAGYTPGPLQGTSSYPGGHWIQADSDAHGTVGTPENTTITSPPLLGFGDTHYMMLRFEQSFRQLNDDQTLVHVSGDGGEHWVTYPVNQDLPGNQMTPGAPEAQMVTMNISSALTPLSNDIRIRFEWISDEGYTYSWQVDEISLLPVPQNNLTMLDLIGEEHAAGTGYYGTPCTSYPLGEMRTLNYQAVIGNNGSLAQTNVRLRAEITGPDGLTSTHISPAITLTPAAQDTLLLPGIQPQDLVGDYHYVFTVLQDQEDAEPDDNVQEFTIRVDNEVFARDEGQVENSRDNGGDGYELGNRFWVQGYDRTLEGVDVAVGPGTEPGALITAIVYEGLNSYVGSSDLYTISASDINVYGGTHFIHLPLLIPATLDNERMYLACVYVQTDYGNVFTGTSGTSEPQLSLVRPLDSQSWYYTTATPMVRMRLVNDVGVETLSPVGAGLRAWPSPFEDEATISFTNERASAVRWEMRDPAGRLVRNGNWGSVPTGERRFTLDGTDLETGVYTVMVETGGVRSTVKLVHQARR